MRDKKVGLPLLRHLEISPRTTKLAHLLIPNCISLFLAHLLANFNNFLSLDLVGAHNTMSPAKRPSQQRLSPTEIPYLSQLFTIIKNIIDE